MAGLCPWLPCHMLRTLDRYIIRETLAPFGLTLLILTFLLQIPTIMDVAEKLIAKGVTLPIIGRIVLTLLPSSLAITIPISLLVGLADGAGAAVGRSRGGRHAGLRRQPVSHPASGRPDGAGRRRR